MTMYGYSLLWDNKTSESLEIFKLIVAEFPESSNPYDSLGEAYLAMGNKDLALLNYQKSLALNPENFNAEDQIERIQFPDRKPLTPAQKFTKVYSPDEYKEDLDQLGHRLIKVNPSALKFISKDDFWQNIAEIKAQINSQTTYGQFAWYCSEIIASISCSHSSMGSFYHETSMLPMALRFPVKVRWLDEHLYIIDPLNNQALLSQKDEIMSINGIPVGAIMKDIFDHIPTQGYIETSKTHYFNSWANSLLPYALGFPNSYQIKLKARDNELTLKQSQDLRLPINSKAFDDCGSNLCLDFIAEKNAAVLTISSFNYYRWNNYDEFTAFIDRSFAEIEQQGVQNLIIDLRLNGGGSPESSIYLLQHLINESFTYFTTEAYSTGMKQIPSLSKTFDGQLFFLIDGQGKSTTGHFMAIAKELKLGTIIGEELGSNQFCTAGQTVCRLSNTKLEYYVANTVSKVGVTNPQDEQGILPDYYVSQSIGDFFNHHDTVKAYALSLINE